MSHRYYFAVHNDIIDNPKVMTLPLPSRWMLVQLWAITNGRKVPGTLPGVTDIAFRCRCTETEAEEWIAPLISRGLIARSGDAFRVVKWEENQPKSAQGSADRTREWRGRKKAAQLAQSLPKERGDGGDVTVTVTRDVTVTAKEKKSLLTESPSSLRPESQTETPSVVPPLPPEGAARADRTARPPGPTPEAVAVGELAERLFPCSGMAPMAERACLGYEPAWVAEALQAARDAGKTSWNYVLGILKRFNAQGGPDSSRASPDGLTAKQRRQKASVDTFAARYEAARKGD